MLDSYISLISSRLEKCTHRGDKYNFRCNICHDSKKDKRKKRAYLLKKGDNWTFYCHNGCGSMSAQKWMKEYFPEYYSSYIVDSLKNNNDNNFENIKPIEEKQPETKQPVKSNKLVEHYKDCKFVSIKENIDSEDVKLAVELCQTRKLLPEVWEKFKVCIEGKLQGRMIIPFFNKSASIEYFQARSLHEYQHPKYICMIGPKKIYNWDFIDNSKPVIVCEGPIDASFIENGIALVGLDVIEEYREKFDGINPYFLFDNDDEGKKVCIEHLRLENWVFNWSKFILDKGLVYEHIKDVNDVQKVLIFDKKIKFNYLEPYFTNNILDIIYFK